ncbi:MAG: N-acetylmuramoyl-L-alanine amidase [Nitrospira sp.]|nr:N-acetylmuramoyl-L-alanine amidase [Nitrospira sp.]MCP9460645.1 N-acetylmuramoyl-L-alanine amidase [Nitrospira sp.]MCP9475731.1 N-acetylmuramoyl-L-alanine amidase [Nitrospira sp.]
MQRSRRRVMPVVAPAHAAARMAGIGLSIENHRLVGSGVSFVETPNKGGELIPQYLVLHYTAGKSARSSINWLTNPESKASAHIVLGRDGSICQLAPFNVKTWHAGVSQWDGLSGLNSYAIGIEMDNAGPLKKVGDRYQAWFGTMYEQSEVLYAKHRLDQEPRWWHAYTEAQIQRALELSRLLVRHYQLREVVGHEDIAPDRKRDPGPAFPLEQVRASVMGRAEEEPDRYAVTAPSLNIRSGPGVEFPLVVEPLKQGTIVVLLEKRDRWNKVELAENGDIEGWVRNQFLEKV